MENAMPVTYTVMLYTDSSKPDNANHRLSVIKYKVTTERPKPPANRCVSIPRVSLTVTPECLRDALTGAFYDLQDKVIRSLIDEHLEREPAAITFTLSETEINQEAIASFYATEELTSGKLSKVTLETWYDVALAELLAAAFAKKNNKPATDETIKKVVINYRTFIAGLAAPRPSYSDTQLSSLEKAIALADASDPIRNQLVAKLAMLRKPKEQLLADSL